MKLSNFVQSDRAASRLSNMSYRKIVLRGLGFISLTIGLAGAFVPLVPSIPFLILAAFLFSKSSREWHEWIRNHPRFGGTVRDWEERGIVRWPIKVLTGSCILSTMLIPFFIEGTPFTVKGIWVSILAPVGIYLISRPSSGGHAIKCDRSQTH